MKNKIEEIFEEYSGDAPKEIFERDYRWLINKLLELFNKEKKENTNES